MVVDVEVVGDFVASVWEGFEVVSVIEIALVIVVAVPTKSTSVHSIER